MVLSRALGFLGTLGGLHGALEQHLEELFAAVTRMRASARRWAASGRDSTELATRNDLQRALTWRARGTTNAAWAARYAPVETDYALNPSSGARAAYFTGAPDALQNSLAAVLASRHSADAVMTLRRTTGSPVRVHSAEYRAPGNLRARSTADAFSPPFAPGAASFDPTGTRIVVSATGGTQLHPLEPGKPAIVLDDSDSTVRAARFLPPDGKRHHHAFHRRHRAHLAHRRRRAAAHPRSRRCAFHGRGSGRPTP